MDRRLFCWSGLAFSMCGIPAFAQPTKPPDAYELWSLLIPILQPHPEKGYLLVQNTAVSDGLPSLQTVPPKTLLQRAMEAENNPLASYETVVPDSSKTSFLEAVGDAGQRRSESIEIESRIRLHKPIRLLTPSQLQDYANLSPAAIPAGWKPDAKVARSFKGWGDPLLVSVPYYDKARTLALAWANTQAGCSTTGWWFFTRENGPWIVQRWKTAMRETCA